MQLLSLGYRFRKLCRLSQKNYLLKKTQAFGETG